MTIPCQPTSTTDSNLTLDSVNNSDPQTADQVLSVPSKDRDPSPLSLHSRKSPKGKSPRVHKHKKLKGLFGKLSKKGPETDEVIQKQDSLSNEPVGIQYNKALSKVFLVAICLKLRYFREHVY